MVAENVTVADPLPEEDRRVAAGFRVILPCVAETVIVRSFPSASPTDTPVMLRGVSSVIVRELTESVTVGLAPHAGDIAASINAPTAQSENLKLQLNPSDQFNKYIFKNQPPSLVIYLYI
jgi:hypothetical protein